MHAPRTLALGLALSVIPAMAGASLTIDRGLPTENLNSAAGADRSNVAWDLGEPEDFVAGDDFRLPEVPTGKRRWRIDRLRTWAIAGSADDDTFTLGDRYNEISLFLGPAGDSDESGAAVSRVATASISGNSTDNPDIGISQVQYNDGSDYQGSSGAFIKMWQIDFLNLGVFDAGKLLFAPDAVNTDAADGDEPFWFNHASNAALSGSTQQGSDDRYRWFSGNALDSSLEFGGFIDSDGFGWDKSSDINVQVQATAVPAPGSWALLAIGLVGLLAGTRGYARRDHR